jgi:hypothetical protein
MDITPTTFRFKFSDGFTEQLYAFAQLHRFDNRHAFKEAWEEWCSSNDSLIENETQNLESNGYKGAIQEKMYKSARYYFRKKKNTETQPRERRKYVSIDLDITNAMDAHIMDWCRRTDFKPATAFSDFCETQKSLLEKEVLRLFQEENLNEAEIPDKLKKTYKNRYFQRVKAPAC